MTPKNNNLRRKEYVVTPTLKSKKLVYRLLHSFVPQGGKWEKVSFSVNKREFFFNEFYIAGYRYYNGERIEDSLLEGRILHLKREPKCQYDSKAVEIYAGNTKIGYIPRKDNSEISYLLDQGIPIKAMIRKRNFDDQPNKRIKIALFKENQMNL